MDTPSVKFLPSPLICSFITLIASMVACDRMAESCAIYEEAVAFHWQLDVITLKMLTTETV